MAENIVPLYQAGKEYLCCSLAGTSRGLLVAWTATGALGLLLAVMLSARIIGWAVGRGHSAPARPAQPPPQVSAWGRVGGGGGG
jgi:hypothetical protein